MSMFPIGQMDYGPWMPGVCAFAGFFIVPLAWWMAVRRKSRSFWVIIWTVTSSLLLLVWLAGLIDLHFEPSIDDVGAVSAVQDLPEVQQFMNQSPMRWPPIRDARVISNSPRSRVWEVTVADYDREGAPTAAWNVFQVNAITGEILVQVNPIKREWVTLETWRAKSH